MRRDIPQSPATTPTHERTHHPDESSLSPLHKAAKEGAADLIPKLIANGLHINEKDQFGSSPLHLASFHGQIAAVEALIKEKDIEINCKDVFNRTPLFYAARNGYQKILSLLIDSGADINSKTDSGETALLKASYYGHTGCLITLLAHKNSQMDEGDAVYGNTPLHNAASKGHVECLKYLLDNGANINVRNSNKYTPLHLAVTYKQEKCLDLLVSYGADLETTNKNNRTPLEDANSLGHKDIASFLKKSILNRHLDQLKIKEISKWTSHDVAQWINLLGFSQYKEAFESNEINGKTLHSLTLTSLKNELNIAPYGHRTTIMKEISKLYKEFKEKKQKLREAKEKEAKNKEKLEQAGADNSVKEDHPKGDLSVWHIDYPELRMGEILGKGFFGEVRRAIWKGTDVAVKVIYRDTFGNNSNLNVFYKELNIISKLRHPNILMFLGACTQGGNRCLVTEYLVGGSLFQLIHHNWDTLEKMPQLRHRIISDIVKGMTYLHDVNILHRDLTSKNLLLDTNMNCKVADFGLSRIREDSGELTTSLGCIPYQAPEVFRGERYSEAADVYSFGMVLYEMVSGFEPHKDLQPLKYANMVAYENYRPNIPPCSDKWEKLIRSCWIAEREKRPTFKEILKDLQGTGIEPSKYDAALSPKQDNSKFDYQVGAYTE